MTAPSTSIELQAITPRVVLDPEEWEVVAACQGPTGPDQLALRVDLDPASLAAAVQRLVERGLASIAERPAAPPPLAWAAPPPAPPSTTPPAPPVPPVRRVDATPAGPAAGHGPWSRFERRLARLEERARRQQSGPVGPTAVGADPDVDRRAAALLRLVRAVQDDDRPR